MSTIKLNPFNFRPMKIRSMNWNRSMEGCLLYLSIPNVFCGRRVFQMFSFIIYCLDKMSKVASRASLPQVRLVCFGFFTCYLEWWEVDQLFYFKILLPFRSSPFRDSRPCWAGCTGRSCTTPESMSKILLCIFIFLGAGPFFREVLLPHLHSFH